MLTFFAIVFVVFLVCVGIGVLIKAGENSSLKYDKFQYATKICLHCVENTKVDDCSHCPYRKALLLADFKPDSRNGGFK